MKIVCGSCSAKYSIADEKVQGKVFKIRCRKCSNVIVVKGTEDQDSGAASAASYGGTASTPEWYVVIDGEQAGPLTPEDLESYYTSGQVSLESFIWRDGMADWTPLGQVEVFAHLAMGGGGGYDEDATSLVESPMNSASDAYEDDATAVVDANAWRQQQEQQDAEAAAAAASVGAAGYAAADFGGGYDPNDPYGDPTAAGISADPYGSSDPYGMGGVDAAPAADPYAASSDFGASDPYAAAPAADPYATPAQAEMQQGYGGLDGGFGSEPSSDLYGSAGSGYDAQASVGGDGGGLFSSFDADAGNDGGLAYQSFSGLDSLQASGVDLNSGGAASIQTGAGGGAAAVDNGFNDANDLVGSRNENSVLFSLSSLQQVEAVKAPSDDVPLTDGSGLIDIQSLASAHQSMAGAGGGGAGPASPFDGPSSAPAVETFSPATMSVPAIMPRGSHRDNKPLIIAVVALALLLALGGIGAAMFFATRPEPAPQQQGITAEELQKQLLLMQEAQAKNADLSESEKKKQAEEIARLAEEFARKQQEENETNTGPVEEEPAPEEKKESKSGSSSKKAPRKSTSAASSSSKSSDPAPSKKDEGKKVTGSGIDSILDTLDKDPKKDTSKPAAKDDTPSSTPAKKKLGKSDVQNTVKKYNSKVKACGKSSNSGNLKGSVKVKFSVAPSGKVSSARINSSNFKGTDVGNCVLKVVRGMKFPAAQEPTTINTYPFFI